MKRFYNFNNIDEYKSCADDVINLVRMNRYNLDFCADKNAEEQLTGKLKDLKSYLFASDRLENQAQMDFMIKLLTAVEDSVFLCRNLSDGFTLPESMKERVLDASCLSPDRAYGLCDSYIFLYDEILKDALHKDRKFVMPSTPMVEMDATVLEAFNHIHRHLEKSAYDLYLLDECDVVSSGEELLRHLLGGTVPEDVMKKFISSEVRGNNCYIAFQKLARDFPEFRNRMIEFSYRNIHVYQQMRTEDAVFHPPFRPEELNKIFTV